MGEDKTFSGLYSHQQRNSKGNEFRIYGEILTEKFLLSIYWSVRSSSREGADGVKGIVILANCEEKHLNIKTQEKSFRAVVNPNYLGL